MSGNAIIPAPRVALQVRPATMDDFAFIDALQTRHAKQLGYAPRAELEGKIAAGHVLVACSEPRASARGLGLLAIRRSRRRNPSLTLRALSSGSSSVATAISS